MESSKERKKLGGGKTTKDHCTHWYWDFVRNEHSQHFASEFVGILTNSDTFILSLLISDKIPISVTGGVETVKHPYYFVTTPLIPLSARQQPPSARQAKVIESSVESHRALAKQWPGKSVKHSVSAWWMLGGILQVILSHFRLSSTRWLLPSTQWD